MNKTLAQFSLNQIQQSSGIDNGVKGFNIFTSLGDIIATAIPWVFTIAGMLLLIYLVFGGIQLMLSGGDPKNAQAAKAHISNGLVGFIIIFIAYWVVQLVGVIFNLPGIQAVFK